jgi:feruloyl esterase
VITAAKLPALHGAVLAGCDGLDGLVDGQLEDPRACRFDPAVLLCVTAAALLGDGFLRFLDYPIGTPHSSLADVRFTAAELHRLTAEGRKATR